VTYYCRWPVATAVKPNISRIPAVFQSYLANSTNPLISRFLRAAVWNFLHYTWVLCRQHFLQAHDRRAVVSGEIVTAANHQWEAIDCRRDLSHCYIAIVRAAQADFSIRIFPIRIFRSADPTALHGNDREVSLIRLRLATSRAESTFSEWDLEIFFHGDSSVGTGDS